MKTSALFCVALLLAGCTGEPQAPAPAPAAPTAAPAAPASQAPVAKHASATGVVQALDLADKTVTVSHDPVEALGWPAMTMTFPAPGVDLSSIKPGDAIKFELTATGMDGTITAISKQ